MRRTKKELLQAEEECRYFLIYNSTDAHKAYNAYIKNYLESGISLPYFVEGIKDFIKTADKMKIEQEQRRQQKEREVIYQDERKNTIEKILSLSVEQFITAYRQAKETGTEKHKMALCDMATLQNAGELKEKFITGYYIDVCKQYGLI